MQISTTSFGEQEIDPDTIITFPSGVPGFEQCTQFKLFHAEEYESLKWLQSIEDENVCFSLMEPILFGYEYEMVLSDEDLAQLQTSDPENLMIMLMVYKMDDETQRRETDIPMNTNWRSPVIINVQEKIGLQKVLSNITKTIKISSA